jgi:hypothetical protein
MIVVVGGLSETGRAKDFFKIWDLFAAGGAARQFWAFSPFRTGGDPARQLRELTRGARREREGGAELGERLEQNFPTLSFIT